MFVLLVPNVMTICDICDIIIICDPDTGVRVTEEVRFEVKRDNIMKRRDIGTHATMDTQQVSV